MGTGGHGHTFPGATAPFGFCQLSPDTRIDGSWDGCGGYHYSDSVIYGFSHTHLSGTGVSDYGDILLMPVTSETALDNYQYRSTFYHKNEVATAGYYKVLLNETQVQVELTASRRCGFHRYTFPKGTSHFIVLDLAHRDEVIDTEIQQLDDYTLQGYRYSKAWATNQKIFFEIKFEDPIKDMLFEPQPSGSKTAPVFIEKSQRVLIKLASGKSNKVQVKVGLSGVDIQGAHTNLSAEIPHWQFDEAKQWVENEWHKELSKFSIAEKTSKKKNQEWQYAFQAPEDDERVIFYTALYHCMIAPNIYSDIDYRYRGRDDRIHSTQGKFDYYTVFSLWDTYRALHPLLTIIDKKRTNDFINTFLRQFEEGGRLPVWELSSNETNCMIGYHAVSVIWDAYNKGIRDYDADLAFRAMKSIATERSDALVSYMQYGYVRADDDAESVSKTLEYAYNDWCVAQMAKALGKTEDYRYFEKRSHNWKNVFDPTTGFMRARKNSTLIEPFSPYLVDNNYTEANSWQYSFYVPHNYHALRTMLGGKAALTKKLDDLFQAKEQTEGRVQSDITGLIGQYAHGNEPSHHIAYLYMLNGQFEKGMQIIKKIMSDFYKNAADGYIGNEDCGQMSAWYVLNALDLYSFCPGKNDFIFFGDIANLRASSDFIDNDRVSITIQRFMNDVSGVVEIDTFGVWDFADAKAYKAIAADPFVSSPFIVQAQRAFEQEQLIELRSNQTEEKIYYSVDTGRIWQLYTEPFMISANTLLQFKSQVQKNKQLFSSPIQNAVFTKLPNDKQVHLKSKYTATYHAGGPMGLVDGIYGKTNWRAGDWQGYQGQDFEAVVALDKVKEISNVHANFLQDQRAWIFFPTQVDFYFSTDSISWTKSESWQDWEVLRDEEHVTLKKVALAQHAVNAPFTAKFIKVIALNYGNLPAWHPGAGNPAYIFIDEIEID